MITVKKSEMPTVDTIMRANHEPISDAIEPTMMMSTPTRCEIPLMNTLTRKHSRSRDVPYTNCVVRRSVRRVEMSSPSAPYPS